MKDYPNEFHSIANDEQTQNALSRVLRLVAGKYTIIKYDGYAQTQIKYSNKIDVKEITQ